MGRAKRKVRRTRRNTDADAQETVLEEEAMVRVEAEARRSGTERIGSRLAGCGAFVVDGDCDGRGSDPNACHTILGCEASASAIEKHGKLEKHTRESSDDIAVTREAINPVVNIRKDVDRTIDTVSYNLPCSLDILLSNILLVLLHHVFESI